MHTSYRIIGHPPSSFRASDCPSSAKSSCSDSSDLWHLSKIQLQTDAQKRNLPLPTYSCEHDGPAHISRFKCKVNLDGRTFESPDCYSTLKDAEDAAARIALLAMSTTGDQEQKGTPNISTNVSSRVNAPLLPKRVNIGRVIILVPA